MPELGAKVGNVADATTVVTDARARHYWDGAELLGKFYEGMLPTPGTPAWDVYLLFAPGVRWGKTPPAPNLWMHQLNQSAGRHLDPDAFAAAVERFSGH